jgi:hypothetical protein
VISDERITVIEGGATALIEVSVSLPPRFLCAMDPALSDAFDGEDLMAWSSLCRVNIK